MRDKGYEKPSVGDVDLSADTIELFLGRNVGRLRSLDHHLVLLVAPGKRMVERHVGATLDVFSWHVEAQVVDQCPERSDSVQLLKTNLLNDVRTRHVFRRINQGVVSFVDHFVCQHECILVALQPFAEADEALNTIASVSFGSHG